MTAAHGAGIRLPQPEPDAYYVHLVREGQSRELRLIQRIVNEVFEQSSLPREREPIRKGHGVTTSRRAALLKRAAKRKRN